ncbi:MAG: tetratricopeptide repeat protein, partial [Planctomycetes bacterium]|nr:tetratricopeptide repeat protein [Planctomycetota bacterium]
SGAIEGLRSLFPESETARPAGELLARYLLEDFQMDAAESVLKQLVDRFPDSAFAWEELRWLYFNQFRTRDVESLLLEQLDRAPDRDYVLIHLMMTEFRPPVPREGIGYLQSIESRRPGQLPVLRALGYCYWQLGELKQAQTCFEQVLQMAPEDPGTLLMLAVFGLEQNQINIARSFVENLDSLEEGTEVRADQRHWIRSLLYEREEKIEASIEEANRAVELRPSELKYAYQRATLLSRMGRNAEAEQAYQAARNLESAERQMADLVLSGSLETLTIEQALTIADLYERRNRPQLAEQWRASVDRFRRKAGV